MQRHEKCLIPKEHFLDGRETHIEYQKSKRKVLHKDNWRTDQKRSNDKMEEFWKGKTIYKIKDDYDIPADIMRSDLDRQRKLSRGNLDELFHPESASSSKPASTGPQVEVGKKKQKGPSLKKFEVGPPAAKRHVGKQKPIVVDDGSSKRKKVVVSYPPEEDELDRLAKEQPVRR